MRSIQIQVLIAIWRRWFDASPALLSYTWGSMLEAFLVMSEIWLAQERDESMCRPNINLKEVTLSQMPNASIGVLVCIRAKDRVSSSWFWLCLFPWHIYLFDFCTPRSPPSLLTVNYQHSNLRIIVQRFKTNISLSIGTFSALGVSVMRYINRRYLYFTYTDLFIYSPDVVVPCQPIYNGIRMAAVSPLLLARRPGTFPHLYIQSYAIHHCPMTISAANSKHFCFQIIDLSTH